MVILYGNNWLDKNLPYNRITELKELRETITDNDLVIPLMEENILEIHASNLNKDIFIMPSYNMTILFMNKKYFYTYCKVYDLLDYIPLTSSEVSEVSETSETSELIDTQIDILYKPILSKAGNGITYNICELKEGVEYISQQIIKGKYEYVSHVYVKNGKCVNVITYMYEFPYEIYIKGPVKEDMKMTKIELDPKYILIFEKFLFDYTGICCIDFKFLVDKIYILEINPRIGGSLMLNRNRNDLINFLEVIYS